MVGLGLAKGKEVPLNSSKEAQELGFL